MKTFKQFLNESKKLFTSDIFYHGTGVKFDKFDPKFIGSGADTGSLGFYGQGFYLTGEPWKAHGYAYAHKNKGDSKQYVMKVKVSNINKVFVIDGTSTNAMSDAFKGDMKDFNKFLKKEKYDAVVVLKENGVKINELIVFDHKKLKIVETIDSEEFVPSKEKFALYKK